MEWWFRAYTFKRSRVSRWFRSLERDNIVCRSQYLPRGPSELGQPCSEFSSWSVSLARTFRNTETCFIAATLSLSLSLFRLLLFFSTRDHPRTLLSAKQKFHASSSYPIRSTSCVSDFLGIRSYDRSCRSYFSLIRSLLLCFL